MLGFGDKAFEFFRMINPIEHARTKELAKKYKVEPYVISADVYAENNLVGRGGWTWYTGSSSWMYIAGIKYILGLKQENGYLSITPCIPKDWKKYSIKYKYKDAIFNITIYNENGKNSSVAKFLVNGEEIADKKLKLEEKSGVYNIDVFMG